jgi:hypothetical protein
MIATTIMISTRVKPALRMFLVCFILVFFLVGFTVEQNRWLLHRPQLRNVVDPVSKLNANLEFFIKVS